MARLVIWQCSTKPIKLSFCLPLQNVVHSAFSLVQKHNYKYSRIYVKYVTCTFRRINVHVATRTCSYKELNYTSYTLAYPVMCHVMQLQFCDTEKCNHCKFTLKLETCWISELNSWVLPLWCIAGSVLVDEDTVSLPPSPLRFVVMLAQWR